MTRSGLPLRYTDPWKQRLVGLAMDRLRHGDTVLEIGGGDRPALRADQRQPGMVYVGLDLDESGLAAGGYDECIVGSIEHLDQRLIGRFDLVLSWNTFEHVEHLDVAFDNMRAYLRPGGALVALFSSRWAVFAIAARRLPHALRKQLMTRLLGATPEHHFPVRYDKCSYRQLIGILAEWGEPALIPLYRGAGYFVFAKPLQKAYLVYENWAQRHPNLATHYLVTARRRPEPPTASR